MELRNTEYQRNTGTPAEQQNTGRTIGIPRNSGTCEEQRNNVTTKQHQGSNTNTTNTEGQHIEQITQENSKQESYFSNKVILAMKKLNPVRRQFQ